MDEKMLDGYLLKEIVVIDRQHVHGTYIGALHYCDEFRYYYIYPDSNELPTRLSFNPHHIVDHKVMANVLIIVLGWAD